MPRHATQGISLRVDRLAAATESYKLAAAAAAEAAASPRARRARAQRPQPPGHLRSMQGAAGGTAAGGVFITTFHLDDNVRLTASHLWA
jgi:hypothetical protein